MALAPLPGHPHVAQPVAQLENTSQEQESGRRFERNWHDPASISKKLDGGRWIRTTDDTIMGRVLFL